MEVFAARSIRRTVTSEIRLFHAVQRITSKMSKRHVFYGACISELRLAFRTKGDQGGKIIEPTPDSEELTSNLEKFVEKWNHITFENHKVLTDEAVHEIVKLKVHVSRGCLSGIAASCGTNRNEGFHRYIRTFFHNSRIGTLAICLCTS